MRRLCKGAGVVLVLCVAVVLFILPRLIDRHVVREKIVYLLSQKISGTVTLQDADVSLFPVPRVVIRNAGLSIPEKVSGSIRTLTVYPELRPLLHGEVKLARVRIDGPSLTIHVPAKIDDRTKSLEEIAALLRSFTLGSRAIRLSVDNGSVTFEKRGVTPVSIKEIKLGLELASAKDGLALTIFRLSSRDPGLSLSAVFRVNPSANMISLEAQGRNLEISGLRSAALALAGDVPVVQSIFTILRRGNIEQIVFQSKGNSLEDLGGTANIKIRGSLQKGEVFVPGPRLNFRDVKGQCDVANGILRGSDIFGRIAHSLVKDGLLSIGLKGADALFHLEASVSADLNDVPGVLKKVVKNREFLDELGHIRFIKGRAEGRLVLGENLSRVLPVIDIRTMSFTSEYDRIPYLLEVRKGSFSYDEHGVAVKSVDVAAGKSSCSDLNAQLLTESNARLAILSGKAGIDTGEMHRWLSSYDKLKAPLSRIVPRSGRLKLSSISFQGLVSDWQSWDFRISGSAEKLLINTTLLPGPLSVRSGNFETLAGQLVFTDARAGFLDAATVVSGSLNMSLDNVRKADIRVSGTVGPKALKWIKDAFDVPEYVRTDQTIAVSDARLIWLERGETAFQGSVKTAGRQSVVLDLSKGLDGLMIRKLHVSDTVSDALLSFDLREKIKRLSFKGRLDTSTVGDLIAYSQTGGGMVQGEITAEFSDEGISGVIAQGGLRAEKVVLPWKKDLPLLIDSLDLSAERGNISIGSARLRLGRNAVFLKGNVASKAGSLVVDIDATSDHIVWDDIGRPDGNSAKKQGPSGKQKKPLDIQGLVRLNSDILEYEGFRIVPFNADMILSAGKTDLRFRKARLCGIEMTGNMSLSSAEAGREIGMDLRFEATDQELKPTVLCLSKARSDAAGLFTLKGHIKGQSKAEDLRQVINGKIEFTAKKGTIFRYKTLDSVFDFLNKGEELSGQMPDLDKSELSYELFKFTATAGKGSLEIEEAILDSAYLGIVAQGSLDLTDNQLDLNVMVAPLRQVNRIVRNIPVIGAVISGSLISVPVKVTGTPVDPHVTYLSPSAAASNLAGMMKRTINLPVSIISPLFPKKKQE